MNTKIFTFDKTFQMPPSFNFRFNLAKDYCIGKGKEITYTYFIFSNKTL
jgi:hypothetical protein